MTKSHLNNRNQEILYFSHILSEKRSEIFYCFISAMVLNAVAQIALNFLWWTDTTFHETTEGVFGFVTEKGNHETVKTAPGTDGKGNQDFLYLFTITIVCGLGTVGALLILRNKKIKNSSNCPSIAVALWTAVILVPIAIRHDGLPLRIGLGWIILETFLIWVTLPVRCQVALIYTVWIGAAHTCLVLWKGRNQPLLLRQLAANLTLLVAANILGAMAFHFNDKRQRLAFEDTRLSLECKEAMEAATKEQKRLLFSVLPRHLADTMSKDMGATSSEGGAFKKIYMNRHEPVSILFADIVGFTAMSAAIGSAAKLVEILNDLFSDFDSLAEQYQQVRIKILGDCYYCICGAPEEHPEHAVLSVYMGLAVTEAIKVFQKRTNSEVDMRVGIHTGAVLAGVLGQRQWQFDVYSKDVELANKMESSGSPGRVHISNKTLSFLNGEFEVEPGEGEINEEKLRLAGIKTYFITKVLKPFIQCQTTNGTVNGDIDHQDSYEDRLKAHMKIQHSNFSTETNPITLHFKDVDKETGYASENDPSDGPSFFGLSLVLIATMMASVLAISFNIIGFVTACVLLGIICSVGMLIVNGHLEVLSHPMVRKLLVFLFVMGITSAHFMLMIPCFEAGRTNFQNSTLKSENLNTFMSKWKTLSCYFPSYLMTFSTLCLLALVIIVNIPSWLKMIFSFGVLGFSGTLMNLEPLKRAMLLAEFFTFASEFDLILESVHSVIFFVFLFLLLFLLNRQLEVSSRSLFLQKFDVIQKREQAVQLRHKNEALMRNIMPQHVAEHFMDKTRDLDVLYSHNYLEVGVLFASMPNFADFYTEDAVNNQGLECLRFLNEVISDYDAILSEARFNDKIIKIKTIGSTYMAASGLNPNIQADPNASIRERWRHLSLLVEFVLEMKAVLDHINKESYNNFVLRIGLNYGPVTAGVIGATKPAYDIWGNTVNVSSRMESTGKAGKVQVTEDCYKILRIYGYQFEQRGYVSVKGKGQLMTYFLIGRGDHELSDDEVEVLERQEKEAAIANPEV